MEIRTVDQTTDQQDQAKKRDIFHNEEGFSTVGMVVALLVVLSLMFSAAQVYQINSTSADIQNVADMAALAAENEVAEYYLVAQVCDAVVLSFSLTGVVVTGVGVVTLCIPATSGLGRTLVDQGTKILKARDEFAQKASAGLNKAQKAIPYLCAASAAGVISASKGGQMNTAYQGFAVAMPFEGEEVSVDVLEGLDETIKKIEEEKEPLVEAAEKAEEAARKANEYKKVGFAHDCGNDPNYCMYERASHLSSLSAESNPLYQSVDTWNFSVAIKRAQAYYPARLANETPLNTSAKEQAQSALRKRFYAYSVTEVNKGYVVETEDDFDAYFPRLPKNTEEMKQTSLYSEAVYPVSAQEEKQTMHAYGQCPGITGSIVGYGSAQQCDAAKMTLCGHCEFSVANLGKVAAASTSIENGFEYHYNKVADAAELYKQAKKEYQPIAEEVKGIAEGLFEHLGTLAKQASSKRIEVKPPGRFGSVAFVMSADRSQVSESILSSFVQGQHFLGTRAAISAATLVKGSTEEGSSIMTSLLDGVSSRFDGVLVTGSEQVLSAWSSILLAYTKGQEGISDALKNTLGSIPLMSESGLGSWAADAFTEFMEAIGLEPADICARRPALVNSIHVATADDSAVADHLLSAKAGYRDLEQANSGLDLFTGSTSAVEGSVIEGINWNEGTITIASIDLFGDGGLRIPITLTLPPLIKDEASSFVDDIRAVFSGFAEAIVGGRRWE